MKNKDEERFIVIIEEEFKKLGYVMKHQVFKCHEYGIPQKRERLLIVGVHKDYISEFNIQIYYIYIKLCLVINNNELSDSHSELQLGDGETNAYLLNGKHLLIMNNGDVWSTVIIRKDD